jgi:hypothetical protein
MNAVVENEGQRIRVTFYGNDGISRFSRFYSNCKIETFGDSVIIKNDKGKLAEFPKDRTFIAVY